MDMRSLMLLGLVGSVAAGAVTGPASPLAAPKPMSDQGLCRRAPALVPLPPEAAPKPNAPRWESRSDTVTAVDAPLPPPPPAMEPVPPAPPAPSPEIAVTGTRVEGKRSAATAVDAISARDVGRFPDASVSADLVPTSSPHQGPAPQAGLLTAGDHDDLLNPELYARYVTNFLKTETLKGVPRVDTGRVLTVEVKDGAGRPVPFANVTLTCADGNTLTLGTVADGTAVFFPGLDRLGSKVTLSVARAGQREGGREVAIDPAPGQQRQTVTLGDSAPAVQRFDLALVIDTTGSMGDELDYLKAELGSILADIGSRHPGLDIRLALIPYRDKGDEYVTRTFPFTRDLGSTQANLRAQVADGGGDYPEAVEQAMTRAMMLDWRPDAIKSLLWVADAPPHAEDVPTAWAAAEVARDKRIQIVPVGASGVGEGAEYIMRAMAAATQSRYIFLTDDSGIGNPHAPPAVDCYLVTRLNALIRRVLDAQISGRRVEPGDQEVIRAVGTYDHGRCVLPPDFAQRD
jgi:hypothetical protein